MNILSALLAKRNGARHAVALVNIPGFIPLVAALGVDAVINPSQITVSSILEHVRRGRIQDVHPIIEDLGEVQKLKPCLRPCWLENPCEMRSCQRCRHWWYSKRW